MDTSSWAGLGQGVPFSPLWEVKEDCYFFRSRVIYPKVSSFTNGVDQRSAPPVITNCSFPKVLINSSADFEKIQAAHGTFSEKMPAHQLCQLPVGHWLKGENASNKQGLACMLGLVPCLCDTLCQRQLRAKRQTWKATVETRAALSLGPA